MKGKIHIFVLIKNIIKLLYTLYTIVSLQLEICAYCSMNKYVKRIEKEAFLISECKITI